MTESTQTSVSSSFEKARRITSLCYVTEIDLDRRLGGAITTDIKTINCLRKLVEVDSVYLKMQSYRSAWLALAVFVSQILQSISKPYGAYFSRGLFASFSLILLKPFHHKEVIHYALSVPFPSIEAKYSERSSISRFVWFSMIRFLERVVTANADAIVVAADDYGIQLSGNGVQRNKIHVVPFFVEDEFFQQPIRSNMNGNGVFKFCYIGGFHPYHILYPVIEAFKQLQKDDSKIELYLVGDGPLRPKVEDEVSKTDLSERIRFIGRLPHASVATFLSSVDCLIVPTTYGISTNLLEGAAAAKAIITMKRKGDMTLEHYFKEGKEILYAEEKSPNDIAQAMQLILGNPEVRDTISAGARKVAKRYFSEQTCLSQLSHLLENVDLLGVS